MATSLTPYASAAAGQATADLGAINKAIRRGGLVNTFLAIGIIYAAAWCKVLGMDSLVWLAIILTEVYAFCVVVPYLFGATPPTWVATFLTGTAGDENKIPEGLANANKWAKKVWRFGLWFVCYSSVPLWVVALFDAEHNFHLILPLIAAGLGVVTLVVLLFEGNFFAWLMYGIKLAVLLILLGMALPGKPGIVVTYWVEKSISRTASAIAEYQARRTVDNTISGQQAACYNKLAAKAKGDPVKKIAPVIPAAAEFEACDKIGVEKSEDKPAGGGATSSATPMATAATSDFKTSWWDDYTPSSGARSIGRFEAGCYRFVVTGTHILPFIYVNGASELVKLDGAGRWMDRRGHTQIRSDVLPGHAEMLVPGKPWGAVVAQADGNSQWVADGACVTVGAGQELALNVNVHQHPDHLKGSGTLRVRVEKV